MMYFIGFCIIVVILLAILDAIQTPTQKQENKKNAEDFLDLIRNRNKS
jgi:hypothetical protein